MSQSMRVTPAFRLSIIVCVLGVSTGCIFQSTDSASGDSTLLEDTSTVFDTGPDVRDTESETVDTSVESEETDVEPADTHVEPGDTGPDTGDTGLEASDGGPEAGDVGPEAGDTGCGDEDHPSMIRDDFEGDDPEWSKHYEHTVTDRPSSKDNFEVSTDSSPSDVGAIEGQESGLAEAPHYGTCGYGGLAKRYELDAPPETIDVAINASTDPYGRVNVIIRDEDNYHVVWEGKRDNGNRFETSGWKKKVFPDDADKLSENEWNEIDSTFILIIGNADQSDSYCHNARDHGWTIWADEIEVASECASQ